MNDDTNSITFLNKVYKSFIGNSIQMMVK